MVEFAEEKAELATDKSLLQQEKDKLAADRERLRQKSNKLAEDKATLAATNAALQKENLDTKKKHQETTKELWNKIYGQNRIHNNNRDRIAELFAENEKLKEEKERLKLLLRKKEITG